MGISGGPDIIQDGLVLSLDAADRNSYVGSGTTWRDMSGNNNNGTLVNGPTFNSANEGSIVFDGVNNYVTIPHNSVFNMTSAMSFNFWFKSTKTVDCYISTKTENSFYICVGPVGEVANKMSFYLQGTSGANWIQSVSDVSTGNWIHTIITWDSSTGSKIYLNGILDKSTANTGTASTGNSPVLIGARFQDVYGGYGSGNISNFSIYNRALSASEVLQNYNAVKTRFGL
jgi:hypothetical protein